MGNIWFWIIIVLVICSVNGRYSSACLEEERVALLKIKASFKTNNIDPLPSWVDNKKNNCCEWKGVRCSNITMQVNELSINNTNRIIHEDWYFNASLYLPFKNLTALHLPSNNLIGWFKNEAFDKLSKLRNLKVVDLSSNNLNRSVLSSLSQLSSLKSLYLRRNTLDGSTTKPSFERLSGLSNLEVLDLGWTLRNETDVRSILNLNDFTNLKYLDISGNGLHTFGSFNYVLGNLSNLEQIVLDDTPVNGSFLQSIGLVTSLKILSMSGCGFNGTLTQLDWCGLENLQELILRDNHFHGILPSCLGNLTSFRLVDISNNLFTGNIAFSPLSKLTSLHSLDISGNSFNFSVSFEAFANHSKLIEVYADGNIGVQETDQSRNTWIPMFQLDAFSMSNCNLQTLPRFLYHQNKLRYLDLSGNHFGGSFPNWLLENNTIEGLLLGDNAFTGSFNLPSHAQPSIKFIGVSRNQLSGQLQANISAVFPNLAVLNMSGNRLEGQIPSSIWGMKHLESLVLSNNQFSGELPTELANSSLTFLGLSHNKLQGKIFEKSIPPSLVSLHLNGNKFIGEIPNTISSIDLDMLAINNNNLSGMIPQWMGQMSGLLLFTMSKNQLQGPIPIELCYLRNLMFLDLSDNLLSGSVPSCFSQLESLQHLFLEKNHLSGNLTHVIPKGSGLHTLGLSYNNFTGGIPHRIGNLSMLSILLLKHNQFEGEIPNSLCHLRLLRMIDLSHNKLTGSIPRCLSNISTEVTSWKTMFSFPLVGQILLPVSKFAVSVEVRMMVEFTTKSSSLNYGGSVLRYMSGIDLSSNQLSGEIPIELGNLSEIQVLNLSHNILTGSIPTTFSNLHEIGCIDLSYNNLSGMIPDELLELHSLAVFIVAHNNLSGVIPKPEGQFSTFDENSYEGNPFLCGPPLHVNCNNIQLENSLNAKSGNYEEGGFTDMEIFNITFSVAYTIFFFGVIITLCINHYWRTRWFIFVDNLVYSCYYFLIDIFTIRRK